MPEDELALLDWVVASVHNAPENRPKLHLSFPLADRAKRDRSSAHREAPARFAAAGMRVDGKVVSEAVKKELRDAGYKVQVLEYNGRPGGRNWSLYGGDKFTEMGGATQEVKFAKGGVGATTVVVSCGAINSWHDSFTPLGGLAPLLNTNRSIVPFMLDVNRSGECGPWRRDAGSGIQNSKRTEIRTPAAALGIVPPPLKP